MQADDAREADLIFVSYTQVDREWAEWLAWELEATGYRVVIQAWDSGPGVHWPSFMKQAMETSARTVAVLSDDYQKSHHTAVEYTPPLEDDPDGSRGRFVPVRVRDYQPYGQLSLRTYIDLVGVDEAEARARLRSVLPPRAGGEAERPRESAPSAAPGAVRLRPVDPALFPGQIAEPIAPTLLFSLDPAIWKAYFWFLGIGLVCLSLAYFLGSPVVQGKPGAYWDRLFNGFGRPDAQLTAIGFGPGWLIEVIRLFLLVTVGVVFIPGWAFREAAGRLFRESPVRRLFGWPAAELPADQPAWEPRVGFGVLVAIGTLLMVVILGQHLITGPEFLWEHQGLAEPWLEEARRQDPDAWKPSGPATWRNPAYVRRCLLIYVVYMPYSIVNFPIALNVLFSVSTLALLSDLVWMYRWPSWFAGQYAAGAVSSTNLRAFFAREFLDRLAQVLERYNCLLLFVLMGWTYVVWLDRINLTPTAYEMEKMAILVSAVPLFALVLLSTMFFHSAREAVARRSSNPRAFVREHSLRAFYLGRFRGSAYSVVSGVALVAIVLFYVLQAVRPDLLTRM